jgi:hypothetical protein
MTQHEAEHTSLKTEVYSALQTPAQLHTVFIWCCPDRIPDGFTQFTDYAIFMFVFNLVRLTLDITLKYPTRRTYKSLPTTFLTHSIPSVKLILILYSYVFLSSSITIFSHTFLT